MHSISENIPESSKIMYLKNSYDLVSALCSVQVDPEAFCAIVAPLVERFRSSFNDWDEITLGSKFRVEFSRDEFPCPDQYYEYMDYEYYFFRIGRTHVRVTVYNTDLQAFAIAA